MHFPDNKYAPQKSLKHRRGTFNGTSDGDVWLASSLRLQVLESLSPWLLAPLPLHPHSHPHHIHFTSHPSTLFHSHSIHSHRIHSHHLYHKHIYTRHMPVGYHTGHPPTSLRSTSICTPPIHTPRLGIETGDNAWKLDFGPPKAQGLVIQDSTSTCQLDLLLNIVY